jgi:hypothetical protein
MGLSRPVLGLLYLDQSIADVSLKPSKPFN